MRQEDLLKRLKEHLPIVVNFGDDIKENAVWDEEINSYRSEICIWDTKLLIEIAKGKINNTTLELEE